MKICPKCGTSLDDDKKKCYMCGADLVVTAPTNFGDSFDAQIGATVISNQQNVYNNMNQNFNTNQNMGMSPDMNSNFNSNVGMNSSGFNGVNAQDFNNFSNQTDDYNTNMTNSGADFFNNSPKEPNNEGLNSLNSMQFDTRTPLEKMFSGNKAFKSKDELNNDLAQKKAQSGPMMPKQPPISNGPGPMQQPNNSRPQMNFTAQPSPPQNNVPNNPINQFINQQPNNPFPTEEPKKAKTKRSLFSKKKEPETEQDLFNRLVGPKEEDNIKPFKKKQQGINWKKELDEMNPTTKVKKNPFQKTGAYFGMLMNAAIFVAVVIGIFAVYFIFFKPDEVSNFGNLTYTIDEKFVLKNEDSHSRYYTYGDNCAIQVKYGATDNNDIGFISNYFDSVKEQYKAEDGYLTQSETLNIGENNWSSLSILTIAPNPAEDGGTQTIVKYRYVSIIYKGNYYQVVYANNDNNNECSSMYDSMIDSMAFEEPDNY